MPTEAFPVILEELEEAKQAISLAIANEVIRDCFPYIDDVHVDPCYELLTDEDRELDKELEEESMKKRCP